VARVRHVAHTNGNRVREFRLQMDYTQEDLAQASGVSVFTVSRIESGKNQPTRLTRRALAKALKHPEQVVFPRPEPAEVVA
jgi:transcriptional regulator with XRE-family HTH domain